MSQKNEPVYCFRCKQNGVMTEVVFNPAITRVNKAGEKKQIPLDKETKQPHDCPFYTGHRAGGAGQKPSRVKEWTKIADIKQGINDKKLNVDAIVLFVDDSRVFNKRDGSTGMVQNVTICDDTSECRLALWDEEIDKLKVGDRVKIENGYATFYKNKAQVSSGKWGKMTINPPVVSAKPAKKADTSTKEGIPTL